MNLYFALNNIHFLIYIAHGYIPRTAPSYNTVSLLLSDPYYILQLPTISDEDLQLMPS